MKKALVCVLAVTLSLAVWGCSSQKYESAASIAQVYQSCPKEFDAAAQAMLAMAGTDIYVRDHLERWETTEDYVIQQIGQLYFIAHNSAEEDSYPAMYDALAPVFENTDVSCIFPVLTPNETWQIQFLLETSYGINAELYYTQTAYEAPIVGFTIVDKQQIDANWVAVITSD